MGIVPKDKGKRITWYKVRVPKWAEDPEGIGSTPEQIAELQAIVEEARLARVEQHNAQRLAKAATLRLHLAMERLSLHGSTVVRLIRATAGQNGNAGVYVKTLIPPPRKKSKMPPPGKPYDFDFNVDVNGWLTLTFKCDNPANACGTHYRVSRQLNGTGAFEILGTVGKKKCRDKSLPQGVRSVIYQVRGQRGRAIGPAARFEVSFGNNFEGAPFEMNAGDIHGGPDSLAA